MDRIKRETDGLFYDVLAILSKVKAGSVSNGNAAEEIVAIVVSKYEPKEPESVLRQDGVQFRSYDQQLKEAISRRS